MSTTDASSGSPAAASSCWLRTFAVGLLLTLAAGCAGYWQLYSSFAPYDDEGYVLLSLRTFRAGHPLYDETATQYGPAFFLLQDAFHSVIPLPVTHDVARLKTLLVWLAAALLSAGIVYRLTGRRLLAFVIGAGTMWHLDRLGLEPGHPQDLAILLLAGALWITTTARKTVPQSQPDELKLAVFLGALAGVLALIKLNLGVLTGLTCAGAMFAVRRQPALANPASPPAITPVSPAMAWSGPLNDWHPIPHPSEESTLADSMTTDVSRPVRISPDLWGWWGVIAVGVALPGLLAGRHLLSWEGMLLPLVVMTGWLGIAVREQCVSPATKSSGVRMEAAGWQLLWIFTLAGLGSVLLVAGWSLAHGTTPQGLWHGLVGQHRGFLNLFYHHPPLPLWSPVAALGGLALALWSHRDVRAVAIAQWVSLGLLLVTGLHVFCESFLPIRHGLDDRAAAGLLAACVPPLAWAAWGGDDSSFARKLICLMAVAQPLGAYPTPGTQLAIATWPALLVLALLTSDLLTRCESSVPDLPGMARILVRGVAVLALLTLFCRDLTAWRKWSAAEPLGLPGAAFLRLPPEEAAARRRVVQHLCEQSDLFVASPTGCCSLYLWSGLTPPTTRNVTFWEVQLSDREQQDVIAALERAQRPRLVVDHHQAPVIYREAPLHQYLERRFTTREVEGTIEVWSPGPEIVRGGELSWRE